MADLKNSLKRSLGSASRLLFRPPAQAVRCLMYHAIVRNGPLDPGQQNTPLKLFEEQLAFLAENDYRVIAGSRLVSGILRGEPFPPKSVCLTFDDGDRSLYELAFPVLERFRVPATAFLIAEPVGKEARVTWDEVRGMQSTPWLEIGCHSLTHRVLKGLPPDDLSRQTAGAKRRMEDHLRKPVPLFAYPFGSFGSWDRKTLSAVEQAGFQGAFTSVFGLTTARAHPFLLRRCRVSWRQEIPDFRMLLEGAYDWYAGVQRLQGALR